MKKSYYGVSYINAVTGNRNTSNCTTKKAVIKEAKALYLEGARSIDTFKFSEGVGAVSFNWRIGGRL